MKKLIEGLRRFVHTVETEEKELFASLAKGQAPEVLFITCSDSRIAPSMMTNTRPGDLFVIRNAGNIIPPYGDRVGGEIATVEYAVSALRVKDIIVCGHSNCGAMGALSKLDEVEKDLPRVHKWLGLCDSTRLIVDTQLQDLDPDARLERTIELNVLAQLNHLRTHPSVAARLQAEDINLHGWVYDIGSGHVRAFDAEKREFVPIISATEQTG
jgi:carbonic anhydrase